MSEESAIPDWLEEPDWEEIPIWYAVVSIATNIRGNSDLLTSRYKDTNIVSLLDGIIGIIQAQIVDPTEALSEYFSLQGRGAGLDALASRIGFQRPSEASIVDHFGFDNEGTGFDQAPFGSLTAAANSVEDDFMAKLAAMRGTFLNNDFSLVSLDASLQLAFPWGYYVDNGDMTMELFLGQTLNETVFSTLQTIGFFLKPAGVALTVNNS